MRLITIKTPQSEGKKVAELAFQSGVKQVSFSQLTLLMPLLVFSPTSHKYLTFLNLMIL